MPAAGDAQVAAAKQTRALQIDIYGPALMIPMTNEDHASGEADPNPPIQPKRLSDGTEGYLDVLCKPCGHSWVEHDDHGCLWNLCQCPEPGERK